MAKSTFSITRMLPSLRPSHLARVRDIAWLIIKHGRPDLLEATGLADLVESTPNESDLGDAESLTDDLEALGPTFVKLGQLLSSRADILPLPYIRALSRLHDNVGAFEYDTVREIVESELGMPIDEAYAAFEPEPIAAASIGQVHRATLNDGKAVVVKVQRPDIAQRIQTDLEVMHDVASLFEEHTDFGKRYRLLDILREFRRQISRELDYTIEAQNLTIIADNLSDFDRIFVPRPVDELTTRRVLTMDRVMGVNVSDISDEQAAQMDGNALAGELFHAYLQQVLVDGFFHADPHPGNVMVTDDDHVALIDLGMIGRVSPKMQEQLLALLLAVSENRGEDAAHTGIMIGYAEKRFDNSRFRERITELVSQEQDVRVGQIRTGQLVLQIAEVAGQTGLRIPVQLTMLGKVLLHLDQVGKRIAPDFDPNAAIRKHALRIMQRRMVASLSPGNAMMSAIETKRFMSHLPRRIDRLLDALTSNDMHLRIDAIDENRLIAGLQKIANRITVGLVLAALIMGAATLWNEEHGFTTVTNVIAAVLFFAASTIGVFLVITVLWADRKR